MEVARLATPRKAQATAAVVALATIWTSGTAGATLPDRDEPPIISYGDYVPGSSVNCDGTICEEIMKFLDGPDFSNPEPTGGSGSNYVDKEQFCRNMELAKPANCDANDPPSSPGIDSDWIGNGCGDGSLKVVFLEAVLELGMANYSGSLDNPLPSISFFGACQAHDQCYGMAPSKEWCDEYFHDRLGDACALGTTTYFSQCQSLANAYAAAVAVGGMDAHNSAQDDRACAAWAKDMEQNGCNE